MELAKSGIGIQLGNNFQRDVVFNVHQQHSGTFYISFAKSGKGIQLGDNFQRDVVFNVHQRHFGTFYINGPSRLTEHDMVVPLKILVDMYGLVNGSERFILGMSQSLGVACDNVMRYFKVPLVIVIITKV